MYDKFTTDTIIASLGGYSGIDFTDKIKTLDSDLVNNFYTELEETLKGQDYDSETVVQDSLKEAGNDFFRGMNYQIQRGIERDFYTLGKEQTIEKYTNRDYKTASDETIEQYIDFVEVLDTIDFYY